MASVSLINTPQAFTPAFNPYNLVMYGASAATETSFNYLIDVYSGTSFLRRFRVEPDSKNSYYGTKDISKSLANLIDGDPLLYSFSSATENTQQESKLTIKLGQEFAYNWNFSDNYYNSASAYTGYVGFTGKTPHQYIVGDYIYLTQSTAGTGYTYSEYNNVHKVVYVPDSYGFVIDYPFLGSTPPESGVTRYLDFRKIVYTGLTNLNVVAWDGAIDYSFYTYNWLSAITTPAIALTVLPTYTQASTENLNNGYTQKITNNGFFNIYLNDKMSGITITKNDSTSKTLTVSVPTAAKLPCLYRFPYSPASINSNLGYNWISGDTTWYKINICYTGGTLLNDYYVQIDQECSLFKDTEILFEDTMGSFISVNVFGTKINNDINRTVYKKYQTNQLDDGNYIYNPQSQTNKISSIDFKQIYTVNTGYIKEDMVAVFQNLFVSKNVYINWQNSGVYYPIQLITNSFEPKKKIQKGMRLIDYTFQYKIDNERALNI